MPQQIHSSLGATVRPADRQSIDDLAMFVRKNSPLFVLTGAGCSTASGLGDYRDDQGQWKRRQPITGGTFIQDESARKRYWARSAVGWSVFSSAKPNPAHTALVRLHTLGYIKRLVTQNVDGLHQRAGHPDTINLHGHLGTVSCISCQFRLGRDDFQTQLFHANPMLNATQAPTAPDGDADLEAESFDWLDIPGCPRCAGVLKPDVVFFGENVPRSVVDDATHSLDQAAGMLVIGSSLMVYSGYRFCKRADKNALPIAIVNRGRTRADELSSLRVEGDCGENLLQLLSELETGPAEH